MKIKLYLPRFNRVVFTVFGLASVIVVQAANGPKSEGMALGPGYFYPSVGLEVGYDDNVLSEDDSVIDPIDSMVTVLSAAGREEIYGDASKYAFEAGLDKAWYHSSSDDNYLDGRVFAEAAYFPTDRVSMKAKGGYWRLHDARGTTTLQGPLARLQDEPDKYDLWAIEGEFGYGLEEVNAPRVEVRADYQSREYTNNRSITQFRDRNEAMLGATFKYMIMPATSLLIDGRFKDFDYDDSASELDSQEYRILGGLTWEATAATTGYIKVGWQEKDFDSPSRNDDDQPAWDIGIEWSPLSYSMFGLSSSRKFDESTGTGDYEDRRETRISWTHAWKSYLTSNLFYSRGSVDYGDSAREDDLDRIGVTLDYLMRENLAWQLYYDYSDRDSNMVGFDYDRNQIGLRVNYAP